MQGARRKWESLVEKANSISMAAILLQMSVLSADVILRFTLNRPITGSDELAGFMMIVAVSLCIAYAQKLKAHVSVRLIYDKVPPGFQKAMDVLAYVLGIFVCALVGWRCVVAALQMKALNKISEIFKVPVFPFYLVITVGFLFLCGQLVLELLLRLRGEDAQ